MKTQTSQINDLRGFSEVEEIYPMDVKCFPKSIQTRKLEALPLSWTSEMPAKARLGKLNGDGMRRLQRRLAMAKKRAPPKLPLKPVSSQIYIQKRGVSF